MTTIHWNSGLINFKGRHGSYDNPVKPFPLTSFTIPAGEKHRFRLVNSAAEYSMQISIDGHKLEVVASDGQEIGPVIVSTYDDYHNFAYRAEITSYTRSHTFESSKVGKAIKSSLCFFHSHFSFIKDHFQCY